MIIGFDIVFFAPTLNVEMVNRLKRIDIDICTSGRFLIKLDAL